MQNYAAFRRYFGGILRFELGFFIWVFWGFLRKKCGLIFKSPVATVWPTGSLRHVLCTPNMQCHNLSILMRDHLMHYSVNEHY